MIKTALLACTLLLPWAVFFFKNNKLKFAALSLLDLGVFFLLLNSGIKLNYCVFFLGVAVLLNVALLFITPETPEAQTPFNLAMFIIALLVAGSVGGFIYKTGGLTDKLTVVPVWELGLALVCAALIFWAGFYAVRGGADE